MAKENFMSKRDLMKFFDIFLEYQNLFETNPRLKTALKAYQEKGDNFLDGKMRLADFELPEDFSH